MRRTSLRRALVLITGLTAILASATSAAPAADDISIQVFLATGNLQTKTDGLEFRIVVELESGSGVEQAVVVRIALPDGLRWGTDGPDPGEGCTGTDPAACMTRTSANPVGTIGGGYVWDVVADRAGPYEITAGVEPTEADPDLSNNTDTFRFEVVAAGGGGGGGSAVSASAVKLTPASPKAGSSVAATVRVTAGGTPVRPSRLVCSAAIGSAKLSGTGRARSGSATCTFRTPRSAKGKTVRGSVSLTARGTRFAKRFSAKLG